MREPSGSILPRVAPSNVYRSSDDRWVVIAANHDTLWRRLSELMAARSREGERFATHAARGKPAVLDEMIGEWAGRRTAGELDRIVNEAGVVCAPVYSVADIHSDPYFRERELLVEVDDEVHGPMTVPGVVPKLTGTPGRVRGRRGGRSAPTPPTCSATCARRSRSSTCCRARASSDASRDDRRGRPARRPAVP